MNQEDLEFLFSYCEIPADGQKYMVDDEEDHLELIKAWIKGFQADPFDSRYTYIPFIMARFCYYCNDERMLYHYLDHRNLEKILESKIFLVGNQFEMNDSTEGKYTWDIAEKILKKEKCSSIFIKLFSSQRLVKPFDYYLLSLTQNRDSQALQNYGDVSIGIDSKKLEKMIFNKYTPDILVMTPDGNPINMKSGNAYVFPVRVQYDEEIQSLYIRNTLNILKTAYYTKNEERFNRASTALHFYSLFFKSPKYRQEEEVRFIIGKVENENGDGFDRIVNGKRKIELPFIPELLDSVIVNHRADDLPNDNIDSIKDKVKKMLNKYDFDNTRVDKTNLEY